MPRSAAEEWADAGFVAVGTKAAMVHGCWSQWWEAENVLAQIAGAMVLDVSNIPTNFQAILKPPKPRDFSVGIECLLVSRLVWGSGFGPGQQPSSIQPCTANNEENHKLMKTL